METGEAAAPHEFDLDTAVAAAGDGRYRGEITPRWSIGPYPNGGYVLGVALAAVAAEVPHPDPMAVSAHFLSPTAHGPCEVVVERLRAGRAHSNAAARLEQGGVERMRVLATYGDLAAHEGPTVVTAEPPDIPPLGECVTFDEDGPMPNGLVAEIRRRFEIRFDPRTVGWRRGRRTGRGEIAGWLRFADGREPDTTVLPLVGDAMPPAVFDLVDTGWVPTIEYSVHVRGRPVPGWLRCRFRTRFLIGGYLEEEGEVWDAADRLVAQSRQLARANTPRVEAP